MSTAVALTSSSIRTIQKEKMLQMLRNKNKMSNSLVAYLLASVKNYGEHVAELLTSSAEQRLARVLLRLAHLDKNGPPSVEIPVLSFAKFWRRWLGLTRPRVNLFALNRFRKQGFIDSTMEDWKFARSRCRGRFSGKALVANRKFVNIRAYRSSVSHCGYDVG